MKLAVLLMLCFLASAFAQNPEGLEGDSGEYLPEEGGSQEIEGGSFEQGDEPEEEGETEEGPYEGPEYEDGEGSEDQAPVDPNAPDTTKDAQAAGHYEGGYGGHGGYGHHGGHRGYGGFRHHGYRRRFAVRRRFLVRGFGGGYGGGRHHVDRSTCSVQASYFLSFNGDRRFCRFATEEHDDCQACCEAATRRETRGVNKDDIIGFIVRNVRHRNYRNKREAGAGYAAGGAAGGAYAAGGSAAYAASDKREVRVVDEPEEECVCCIPKHHRN